MEEEFVSRSTVKQGLLLTVAFQLLFSGSFVITALATSNSCFLTFDSDERKCAPNPEGMEEAFGIYGGSSFELVISGMIYLAYGIISLKLLRDPGSKLSSLYFLGTHFGLGIFVTFSTLFMASKWGSICSILNNINCDRLPTDVSCPRNSPLPAYTGIVVLSSFLFIIHLSLTGLMYIYRDEFVIYDEPATHGYVAQTDSAYVDHSADPVLNQPSFGRSEGESNSEEVDQYGVQDI